MREEDEFPELRKLREMLPRYLHSYLDKVVAVFEKANKEIPMQGSFKEIQRIMKKWGYVPPADGEDYESAAGKIAQFFAWADRKLERPHIGDAAIVHSVGEIKEEATSYIAYDIRQKRIPYDLDAKGLGELPSGERVALGLAVLISYAKSGSCDVSTSIGDGLYVRFWRNSVAVAISGFAQDDAILLEKLGWVRSAKNNAYIFHATEEVGDGL